MRIAVTGAAGHLGSHLCTRLAAMGLTDLVRIDLRELPAGAGEARTTNLAEAGAATEALDGSEVIVHCASVHPWKQYADETYLDLNIKGTWNTYAAAAALGIWRVVLTSSIAAVGYTFPPSGWPVSESAQSTPCDLYSYTKLSQELVARHFAEFQGITTIALRPPAFMPKNSLETGRLLLGPFCLVEDIVEAHVAAVLMEEEPPSAFEAFFTTNRLPYGPQDAEVADDGWTLAERYYPGVREWFLAREAASPSPWVQAVYSIEKARELLGWEPKWNFGRWWSANRNLRWVQSESDAPDLLRPSNSG
jgi:nucleoside-diphosphate-sugar epimerase